VPDTAPEEVPAPEETPAGDSPLPTLPDHEPPVEIDDEDGSISEALAECTPVAHVGARRVGNTIHHTLQQGGWYTISWTTNAATNVTINPPSLNWGASATTTATIPVYSSEDLRRATFYRRWQDQDIADEEVWRQRSVELAAEVTRQRQLLHPDENLQERLRRMGERDRQFRAEIDTARTRAVGLLERFLSEEQRHERAVNNYFTVIGSLGTVFRIRPGRNGNVQVMSPSHPGRVMARICAHAEGSIPEADVHLAQMLHLMADEREFVSLANCHDGRRVSYRDGRVVDTLGDTWTDNEQPDTHPIMQFENARIRVGNQWLAA
jgi:hypothetical protein